MYHNRRKTAMLNVRLDTGTQQELRAMANKLGVTVSTLVVASLRQVLYHQIIPFRLPTESLEEQIRRKRWINDRYHREMVNWSKIDYDD